MMMGGMLSPVSESYPFSPFPFPTCFASRYNNNSRPNDRKCTCRGDAVFLRIPVGIYGKCTYEHDGAENKIEHS